MELLHNRVAYLEQLPKSSENINRLKELKALIGMLENNYILISKKELSQTKTYLRCALKALS